MSRFLEFTQQGAGRKAYIEPEAVTAVECEGDDGCILYQIGGRFFALTERADAVVALIEKRLTDNREPAP